MLGQFSQLFVLSLRGDTIIFKDYRGDARKDAPEIFFKFVSGRKVDAPPFFHANGINFVHRQSGGVYMVLTSLDNVSSSMASSYLDRLGAVFRDYCGTLSEEAVRTNFALIYEILDEAMDFGHPQTTASAQMLSRIFQEPVEVEQSGSNWALPAVVRMRTKSSNATMRPISKTLGDKNEIFVDLVEKLTVLFNHMGEVMRADIDGALVMKSYLQGDPEIHLGLSQDLHIMSRPTASHSGQGGIAVEDMRFHPCAKLDFFDRDRSVRFKPAEGETSILTYRLHDRFSPPFKCIATIETVGRNMVDVILKITAEYSGQAASNVTVSFPVPKNVQSASFNMTSAEMEEEEKFAEFRRQESRVVWHLTDMEARSFDILHTKLTWDDEHPIKDIKIGLGPVSMDFEIPMFLCSKMQIRFLRIQERGDSYDPDRWVRYLTRVTSYTVRLS